MQKKNGCQRSKPPSPSTSALQASLSDPSIDPRMGKPGPYFSWAVMGTGCSAPPGLEEGARHILAAWEAPKRGSSGGISLCDEPKVWIKIDQMGTKS